MPLIFMILSAFSAIAPYLRDKAGLQPDQVLPRKIILYVVTLIHLLINVIRAFVILMLSFRPLLTRNSCRSIVCHTSGQTPKHHVIVISNKLPSDSSVKLCLIKETERIYDNYYIIGFLVFSLTVRRALVTIISWKEIVFFSAYLSYRTNIFREVTLDVCRFDCVRREKNRSEKRGF